MRSSPDEVRLSSAVMAHPSRAAHADLLIAHLADLTPRISYQLLPDGDTTVLWSATASWAAVPDEATHHVVFQDDVMAYDGITEHIVQVVRAHPDAGIALFCEWGCKSAHALRIAALAGFGSVEVTDRYVPTSALVLPAGLARLLADRLAREARRGPSPDDVIVKEFMAECGVRCLVTLPNLVEHRSLPSLAGNDWMGRRRAACFPAARAPVLATPALWDVVVLPFFQWRTGQTQVLTRPSGADEWRRDALRPMLAAHGLDDTLASAMLRDAQRASGDELPAFLGEWLPALVDVAVGLALSAASVSGQDIRERLDDPLVAGAWATMAPGALRYVAASIADSPAATRLWRLLRAVVAETARCVEMGRLRPIECRTATPDEVAR